MNSDFFELRTLVLVSDLIIRSAIKRKESRGLHYNLNYPKKFINDTNFSTVQESGTAEIEGTPLHTLINEEKLATYPGAIAD